MAPTASLEPRSEATDLGSLWSQAVNDYKRKTGVDLSHMKALNISDVMTSAESSLQSFQGLRHKGNKVDKVRSAFSKHLDGMQKCMQGIEMVGALAGAFPPAMPVGIIFAACGRLLSSFAAVKADYDKVEQFFHQSSRFFERLSLIENKKCDNGPLVKAIVEVFSAQLSICAFVEARIKEKASRFKDWLGALWNLQDPDLAAAYGTMQASIEELAQTVNYASYAAIKSTEDVAISLSAKADEIDENIKKFRLEQGQDVRLLYQSHIRLEARIVEEVHMSRVQTHAMLTEQQAQLEAVMAQSTAEILKAVKEKSKPDSQDKDKRKQVTKASGKGDAGDKRFKALRDLKAFFDGKSDIFPSWRDAYKENTAQQHDLKESCVDNTGDWLTNDPAFKQWTQAANPLLLIKGEEGIGKSFLAHASFRKLQPQDDGRGVVVAYFYFKEDFAYLQSAQNAFACAALQVAESNPRYAEQVTARLKDDSDKSKDLSTWRRFFLSFPFGGSAHGSSNLSPNSDHLYLIFDGLDEAHEQQKKVFLQFLADLMNEKSRVHVLVTTRSTDAHSIEQLEPLIIEVTKPKMTHDIRVVIWERLVTLARLKKFSHATKKAIRRKIAGKADGMLYVEHMVRRLSYIGREGAVRKELDKMPDNLHDLYRLMLDDCRRNRSSEQYEALKRLFAWLAFSKRSLSLAEASELVKLTVTNDDFDIEDEIIGRSSRILEVSRTRHLDEDAKDYEKDEDNDEQSDAHEAELEEYRNDSLTFQERSLRQYFKAVSIETHGKEELRTPASTAHLTILTMCVDLLISSAEAGKDAKDSELRSYAVKYWHEHLNELDPEHTSEENISRVLTLLHHIVSNKNNVANLFERYTFPSDVYPDKGDEGTRPWYERVHSWAVRGASLPAHSLEPDIEAWVSEISDDPKKVLLPMAQGHIQNWLNEYDTYYMVEAYGFAEITLKLSERFKNLKDNPYKEIISIADAFGTKEKDAKALRAIGTKLFYAGYNYSDDCKTKCQADAIQYLKDSIELMEEDKFEKGATFLALGYLYDGIEDHQNAIDSLDTALTLFSELNPEPNTWMQQRLDSLFTPWVPYVNKAQHYSQLDNKDAALAMYNKARDIAGKDTIGSYWLDQITALLDEKTDPNGHRLVDALKSWTEIERNTWFEGCMQYWADLSALSRMYRAAKLTNETDLVLKWLNAFEKTLPARSLLLLNMKAALADYYSKALGDLEKAKNVMRNALSLQLKVDGSEEDVVNERISAVRLDLAGIIFSQFRASSKPEHKVALLEEMKSLPGMRTDDEFMESHIGMLIANMLRIIGPAREYQKCMDDIFKTCINGLEDNVSWNDGDSLRLLAKALSSLDGLEHDARITISAQFSIMDQTIYDSDNSSRAASEDGEAETLSETEEPFQNTTAIEDKQTHGQPDVKNNTDGKTFEDAETPSILIGPLEQQKLSTKDRVMLDAGQGDTMTNENEEPQAGADIKNATDIASEADDQDITDYSIFCDGNCGTSITKWSEPFYLCLICPNTDLCVSCHGKRLSLNRSNSEPSLDTQNSWMDFCGQNHHYIKGPMKGWRGIKNGIIRVGDNEVSVKEWIKGLKEERWPMAWEKYWLRQGGLKDIDED